MGLYTWAHIYTNTPRSLNYRRSGVKDWTRREYKGLRLERNSEKVEEGSPMVKMSANWEVVGT